MSLSEDLFSLPKLLYTHLAHKVPASLRSFHQILADCLQCEHSLVVAIPDLLRGPVVGSWPNLFQVLLQVTSFLLTNFANLFQL